METSLRVLGQEHPDTLTSMNNLAWTLKSQGRNDEALELITKCVQLSTQKLGANHPNINGRTSAIESLLVDAEISGKKFRSQFP
jgi:hypothetical protein